MRKKILIIAAHPDDEILGAGGTVANHVLAGDEVFCLILGEGALARNAGKKEAEKLHKDARLSAKVIGFKEIYFSNFPDNSFDSVALLKITKEVEKYIQRIKPDTVYTHFENDLNIDHQLTFQAVMTACRPCNEFCPKEIYSFEVLSSTEWQAGEGKKFAPNFYNDISCSIEKKKEAMKKYASELKNYPHPRSLEGIEILAKYRGLESGLKAAEAFKLIRKRI
jgi:LmbE family N-acetylglucosaminyl deacetylase